MYCLINQSNMVDKIFEHDDNVEFLLKNYMNNLLYSYNLSRHVVLNLKFVQKYKNY